MPILNIDRLKQQNTLPAFGNRYNHRKNSRAKNSKSGFTLVELSIVLVIIGLIIASVLVGQDLVRSAELRATVTQYEQFNAAVNTFRGKYNGLPGDITGAASFGFTGDGNANGLLVNANSTLLNNASENIFFWSHLGSTGAALIPGSYAGNATVTSTNIATHLPAAKAGNYWGVYAGQAAATAEPFNGSLATAAEAGTNFFIVGVTGDTGGTPTGLYSTTATLLPLEAKSIDDKLDDGRPDKGIVRARSAHASTPDVQASYENLAAGTGISCVNGVGLSYGVATGLMYNTKGNTTAYCTLRLKMQ